MSHWYHANEIKKENRERGSENKYLHKPIVAEPIESLFMRHSVANS